MLFKQLKQFFATRITNNEKVLFFLRLRTTNGQLEVNRSIKNRLRIGKEQLHRIIKKLMKDKLVEKVTRCPNPKCENPLNLVPHMCKKCGHRILHEDVPHRENNKTMWSYYGLRITKKGVYEIDKLFFSLYFFFHSYLIRTRKNHISSETIDQENLSSSKINLSFLTYLLKK